MSGLTSHLDAAWAFAMVHPLTALLYVALAYCILVGMIWAITALFTALTAGLVLLFAGIKNRF